MLPKNQFDFWKELCIKHDFKIKHLLIEGGATRFQSVKNGLKNIDEKSLVSIHDGVRPFVSTKIIENNFTIAKEKSSVTF